MAPVQQLLPRIRRICLALPETWEGTSFGHPTFHAGKKTFSVVETHNGVPCITLKVTPEAQRELIARPRFQPAPYTGKFGWVCMLLDGNVDWTEVALLAQDSYRLVALKRMIAALDAPRRTP